MALVLTMAGYLLILGMILYLRVSAMPVDRCNFKLPEEPTTHINDYC